MGYKEDNLNALLKNKQLTLLLDDLLPVPGLWGPFKLSTIRIVIRVHARFPAVCR
jgi:hypothetical protein